MPKKKSASPRSFEDTLGQLEDLVEAMESDQLPLEDLVAHYEKGAGLLQHCEKVLAAARKRIELIELEPTAENELETGTEPVDDTDNSGNRDAGGPPDDEIRLL